MQSCLYEGRVKHRRYGPRPHAFNYGLYMCYLDLAELPALFDGHPLWSARRLAPSWFRRGDYLDPATPDLDVAVRDRIELMSGTRPSGPIRLLTHLRTWGYCFNPVSFYYTFAPGGDVVEYMSRRSCRWTTSTSGGWTRRGTDSRSTWRTIDRAKRRSRPTSGFAARK